MKKMIAAAIGILLMQFTMLSSIVTAADAAGTDRQVDTSSRQLLLGGESKMYTLELKRWGVWNDGTHPAETTSGINRALAWAKNSGISVFRVPAGTYTIAKGTKPRDPDARINMVSGMTLLLDGRAVIRKETNGFENYQLLYLGPDVRDAVIRGGTYMGDRDAHDYSKKDNVNSAGTHEGGIGIHLEGARGVVIDGVKTTAFTGDGIAVGGSGIGIAGLYQNDFEAGGVNDAGAPVSAAGKIRTKNKIKLDNPIFQTRRYITFWQPSAAIKSRTFDVSFYDKDGGFLAKGTHTVGALIPLPEGAQSAVPVFAADSTQGAFVSFWSNDVSRDVTIKNSEAARNRRQGITIGGVDGIVIQNNKIYDTGGIAPGFGIDVEGMGFFPNGNLTIKDNRFFRNKGDIVFADGRTALVEGNVLESAMGLYTWEAFTDVTIRHNTFQGNGISIRGNNGRIQRNTVNKGQVVLSGSDITIEDTLLTDGALKLDSPQPFGVSVKRVRMIHNNASGNALQLNNQPVRLTDVSIEGKTSNFPIVGPGSSQSVYERLRMTDYNVVNGTNLPPGTYDGCRFESRTNETNGLNINLPGDYVFKDCTFIGQNKLIGYNHAEADIAVEHSTFVLNAEVGYAAAILVDKAQRIYWNGNTLTARALPSGDKPLIKFGRFVNPDRSEIKQAVFEGNTFEANRDAVAVDTLNAGKDAPPYIFRGNTLIRTTLKLKSTDVVTQ